MKRETRCRKKHRETIAAQQAHTSSHRLAHKVKRREDGAAYCLTFDGPDAEVFIGKTGDNMTQCTLHTRSE